MRKTFLRYVLPVLLVAWGLSALYSVDHAEFAYVTRFGQPVATFDGSADAGLHVKLPWPIESVQRIDRRLQHFDLPPTESLTRDPENRTVDKTLAVDAYVCWRIPDAEAVDKFIRTVGTPEQAKRVLGPRISSRLAAVISNMPLDELIRVGDADDVDRRMGKLRRQLLGEEGIGPGESAGGERLPELALSAYGIEIVDVRLRRFNYPEAVRGTIAERIKSERARKVAEYESEGRRRAADIASSAESESQVVEANARAEDRRVRELADVEADAIRNQAHAQDRDFYVFLQKLKAYQSMVSDTRDVLLLSGRHEIFDLLLRPPKVNGNGPPAAPRNGGQSP